MMTEGSSETSVTIYWTTWRSISEDLDVMQHRVSTENLPDLLYSINPLKCEFYQNSSYIAQLVRKCKQNALHHKDEIFLYS
jgi:hypothetical protein